MPAPAHIAARVEEALGALYRHPERSLLPWYRYAIYTALTAGAPTRGRAARAWLDIAAVRRVLFCWRPDAIGAWPPAWPQPDQLLALAEQILQGTADRAAASARLNRAYAIADVAGEPATSPRYCAWCVYEGALRALGSARAYDQLRARRDTAASAADATGCADDASGYAVIAVAGGAWRPIAAPARGGRAGTGRWNWQTEDARLRRAVFWEWWLREAVPAAWRIA